jgi:preprotein translocase subunit SecY
MNTNFTEKNTLSDIKNRLFFVFLILIIYRIGSHIPVPLIDTKQIMTFFTDEDTGIFSLFNLFSGGALSKVTIFSLGIMPYISSSIIIQLLTFVWDPLIKLRKDAVSGRKKIVDYTRYLTVILSLFQSIAMAKFMLNVSFLNNIIMLHYIVVIITLVSGTMFLMWLGEQINEKGIGNGISLIIFTSIVSNIPRSIGNALEKVRQGEINILLVIIFVFIIILIIFFIISVEMAQRRILINYGKRQYNRKNLISQNNTYLPFKINMAGVIPPIFASSVILFPITLIHWIDPNSTNFILYNIKSMISPGKIPYLILFCLLIIFFSFFYNSLIFSANDISENLKKSGGFISGVRPGEKTSLYINDIVKRLTLFGSLYLAFVSILPEIFLQFSSIPFYFGGTSLLIVVVVIIDFVSQVQTKLISYKYDGLIKKHKVNIF